MHLRWRSPAYPKLACGMGDGTFTQLDRHGDETALRVSCDVFGGGVCRQEPSRFKRKNAIGGQNRRMGWRINVWDLYTCLTFEAQPRIRRGMTGIKPPACRRPEFPHP